MVVCNASQIQLVIDWLNQDVARKSALQEAAKLALPQWCIAAGFVRNLVWDQLHNYAVSTALNDLDLVYYDPKNLDKQRDLRIEKHLHDLTGQPWSVKNQARMHLKHGDCPYQSCADAISYWVEVETAVGASMDTDGKLSIVAPLGTEALFSGTITCNPKRQNLPLFFRRIHQKKWLSSWPRLRIQL